MNLHKLDEETAWNNSAHVSRSPENFIDLLGQILSSLRDNPFVDNGQNTTFSVSDYELSTNYRFAEGVFHRGQFGTTGEFISIEEPSKGIIQEEDTAVEYPFYSFFQVIKGSPKTGIGFFERRGNMGMKTIFRKTLQNALPDDLIIEINPMSGPISNPDTLPEITNRIVSTGRQKQKLESRFYDSSLPDGEYSENRPYSVGNSIEDLFNSTIKPYKYSTFRSPYLFWQLWVLLCASMTDSGELSSEITETQKIIVRTSLATLLGLSSTLPFDANVSVVIGTITFFSAIFESRYNVESRS